MPGPSSPDGVAARVSAAPSERGHLVHLRDRGLFAAELGGDRVSGVVAGRHQQCLHELPVGVVPTRADADAGAVDVGVLGRPDDHAVEVEVPQRDDREQYLDRARGPVAAVRVLGGKHLSGVEVGNLPSGRGDFARQCR